MYAAGGWHRLSKTDQNLILDYGDNFRQQLQPLLASTTRHGGYIMSCLVHCVTGYAFWVQGGINSISPHVAFLRWLSFHCFGVLFCECHLLFYSIFSGMLEMKAFGFTTRAGSPHATQVVRIYAGSLFACTLIRKHLMACCSIRVIAAFEHGVLARALRLTRIQRC